MILAGGKGSRLQPFTFAIPKPLVPVGEVPIIEILLRQLAPDFDRITISVGYLAKLIESYCGDGSRWGLQIDYAVEEEPLGTVGCLSLIGDVDDRLLVINGDTLTDMPFGEVARRHDDADAMTIFANTRSVDIEFGVLDVAADGRLTGYREKPRSSYRVAMGVNVFSAWALRRYLEPGERLDLPELVWRLLEAGESVRVCDSDAYWLDLGRMADLEIGTEVFSAEPGRFIRE